MKVRRYLAENYPEAIAQVKAELGIDAVILHTRTIRQGGFLGFFGKKMIEVTAALEDETLVQATAPASYGLGASRRRTETQAANAYRGQSSLDASGSNSFRTSAEERFSGSSRFGEAARRQESSEGDEYTPQHLSDFLDRFRDSFPDSAGDSIRAPEEIITRTPKNLPGAAENGATLREEGLSLRGSRRTTGATRNEEQRFESISAVEDDGLLEIRRELIHTQALLRQVVEQHEDDKSGKALEMPRYARRLWKQLVANDVDADLATELINGVLAECQAENEQELEELLRKRILDLMRHACRDEEKTTTPQVVALVGPTGVGKTTTLAKLAARKALMEKKRVGLITIDTYRIAAVEQLKTYAKILDLQVQVVFTPQELPRVLAQMSDCEIIFLDTAGRSHKNAMQMSELKAFFDVGQPTSAYLVLSLTTKFNDMMEIIAEYEPLSLDTLIFTKLDETTTYGNLFNLAVLLQKRIAYLADGQNVPEDIGSADPFELTDLVMGKRTYA